LALRGPRPRPLDDGSDSLDRQSNLATARALSTVVGAYDKLGGRFVPLARKGDAMGRCIICGKEREERELKGRICRTCSESVHREATGEKVKEKKAGDRAIRSSGQVPPGPKRS